VSAALLGSVLPATPAQPAPGDGTLVVAKQVTGGTGPDVGIFTFEGSWGESFPLSAGEQKTTTLAAGSYTVTEAPAPGYRARGASCSGPAGTELFAPPAATVSVTAGQAVTCTFTSEPVIDISVEPDVTANARLKASRSCRAGGRLVAQVVAGNATRVSFSVNGRWVGTVRRPYRGHLFRISAKAGTGTLNLAARVVFETGSSPPQARLTRRLAACPSAPAFAGSRH